MIRLLVRTFLCASVFLTLATAALGDDWTATRLRGAVFVLTSGEWVKLNRGDVVSDDSVIRTQGGRARFERDGEAIDVSPETQIRIVDQAGRRFTTVLQDFGKVTIQAEVQNVEHFSVQTPYLAAVVKGTKFSVTTNATASTVEVDRGQVAVEAASTSNSVTVVAGQSASAGADTEAMEVTGRGALPSVVDTKGRSVAPSVAPSSPSPQDNGNNGNHNGHDNENNGNHNGQNKDHANNGNHNGHDKNGKKD